MAVNCILQFDNPANEIIFLIPNTQYAGNIPNAFEGDYYKFDMFTNETMTFVISCVPQTPAPINMQLKLYRKIGTVYTLLGTSFITQSINNFGYDGVPGEYYICLTTDYDINYVMEVQFTSYPFSVLGEMRGYHGARVLSFEFAKKATSCDSPVFYVLESGELPVGMQLFANGAVRGVPLEQDCYTDDSVEPTFTWYETDEEGNTKPKTKEYVFTVRAALLDSPGTYADKTFKICVHNNWSVDRDNFIEQSANFEHIEYEVDTGEPIGKDIPVDAGKKSINGYTVYDEDGSVGIVDVDPVYDDKGELITNEVYGLPDINGLKKINKEQKLPVAEVPQIRQLTESELQELCKICYIAPEYQGLVAINTDETGKLCVQKCEVVEEKSTAPVIEVIDTQICEPCPEPVIVTGLQLLPKTLCDVCVVEEIPEPKVTKYNKKITYCTEEFIKQMQTKKVCSGPIVCPVTAPIYPEIIKEPKLPKLPSSMCEVTCEKN